MHVLPAIIEWAAKDGQSCFVGCSPTNPVHVSFKFDASTKTGSFQLRVAFAWRKVGKVVQRSQAPLHLCLQPSQLRRLSLESSPPSPPPDKFLDFLGRDLACVSVDLARPPVLVAPDWPLIPQNRLHSPALDSVKQLAQLNAFTVYVQGGDATAMKDLGLLCTAVASNEPWPADDSVDVTEFYQDSRGRVVGIDLLAPTSGPSNITRPPPAYTELEPSLPTATLVGTKKRRHASLGQVDTGDEFASIRERIDILEKRAVESKREADTMSRRIEELEQRLAKVEHERDSAGRRVEELETKLRQGLVKGEEQMEQVNEDLEALGTSIDERVWVEVDGLRTAVNSDFVDLQQELRGDVADLVQESLEDVVYSHLDTARIHIRSGSLEITYNDA